MKKWWFSMIGCIISMLLAIYPIPANNFLSDNDWCITTQIITTISSCLLLIIIGVVNLPKKENKNESNND